MEEEIKLPDIPKYTLEKLIKKIEKQPASEWRRETEEDVVELHPDSPCVGYTTEYLRYMTTLKNFKVILERENCSQHCTESYALRVSSFEEVLEFDTEKGLIGPLFKKIDCEFERYQKRQKEENQKRAIMNLNKAIK